MKRRDLLKGALAAGATLLVPWGSAKAAPEKPPLKQEPAEPAPEPIQCANCGRFARMPKALVCSPLCGVWEAASIIHRAGESRWARLRRLSTTEPWSYVAELTHRAMHETYGAWPVENAHVTGHAGRDP